MVKDNDQANSDQNISDMGDEQPSLLSDKKPNKKIEPNQQTFYRHSKGEALRTNQGVKISDNQNTLQAGYRGPSLLEDFIMREKITHFDHERIPERVVHARGCAAHGYFQVYESQATYTKAEFLQDPSIKTPVYVRFSTVQGSRGSADTVRDVRGFAVKFYTQEGNFDLVGNNIPVFFIQDAIKFPDLVHALKPEPHNDMPQGASAHDTFWDFVSLTPETTHMLMWLMSDRAIPKSLRAMEGFGVHTFRFINEKNHAHFVKFHWRPLQGSYSLVWDEAQKLAGFDPDFHRRDLWEAIELKHFPQWELCVQIVEEKDEFKFDFDLLDATKLIPEELVPLRKIGKLVLNRNPDNYFCETEQVAFHPGHIVPGIDFSNDPLLQGRLFSYTDTQISRLGGPNFHELPINQARCPFHNNQRDAMHRMFIDTSKAAYDPNSINDGWPKETPSKPNHGGFTTYQENLMQADKVRKRNQSFSDHYSQAKLFWNSMTNIEKAHIASAFEFELSKVTRPKIRKRVIDQLYRVNKDLANRLKLNLGLQINDCEYTEQIKNNNEVSEKLSLIKNNFNYIEGRKVAILLAPGFDFENLQLIKLLLKNKGLLCKIIAKTLAPISAKCASNNITVIPDATFLTMPSVMFDAVVVPCGLDSVNYLSQLEESKYFLTETYNHLKPIAAIGYGRLLFEKNKLIKIDEGILLGNLNNINWVIENLLEKLMHHRIWSRELNTFSPAA